MDTKQKLLDLLEFAQAEEQALIDSLTDAERAFAGSLAVWSAKDMLAHLYAWKGRYVTNLDVLKAGGTPEPVDDIDKANAAIYEAHSGKTWDEVLKEWQQANAKLRTYAGAFTENELTDPNCFPGQNNQPLWRGFAGNGIIHTALHFGEFYTKRGDVERANTLHKAMVEKLLTLDESDNWHGITLYNLACHYALTGQPNAAISKLGRAFELCPSVIEWSKQDADLKSLHELGAYQLLYAAHPVME